MRLEFRATEGGFDDADDPVHCLLWGVSGPDALGNEHSLCFQRGFEDEDPAEDWGVHFGFDDQINGAYNCVRRCRLARTCLEVELVQPIDWQKKYAGVSVDLCSLDEPTYAVLRSGLPRIFRGIEGVVEFTE